MSVETLSRPLAQRLTNVQVEAPRTPNEPDIAENVIQAASDALDRGETHYADRPGIPELRDLVAQQLNARYGLGLDGKAVTICCGSVEALFSALQVLAQPGSTVVAPRHAERVAATVQLIGAELANDANGNALLYLTPGVDIEAWLDKAEANNWFVIWDISGAPKPAAHPAQRPALATRVLTLDDVEMKMPGWAIGWMAGSEKHMEIRAFKQAMTICATNVSQWAVLEFLKDES
jgi:aspartate/methionine/tyrosine aminotransferase